jgi:hypothetical protein
MSQLEFGNLIAQPSCVAFQDRSPHGRDLVVNFNQGYVIRQLLECRAQPDYAPTSKGFDKLGRPLGPRR